MNYWEEKEKRQNQWLWLTFLIAYNEGMKPKLKISKIMQPELRVISTRGMEQEYDLFPNRLLEIAFKQNISFDDAKTKIAALREQAAPIDISLIIAQAIGDTYTNIDDVQAQLNLQLKAFQTE